MRIAVLVPNFVEFDGAVRVAEVQAKELVKEGHKADVYALASDIPSEGFTTYVLGMPKSLFLQRLYRLLFPLDLLKTIRWLPKLREHDEIIVHLCARDVAGLSSQKTLQSQVYFLVSWNRAPSSFPSFA